MTMEAYPSTATMQSGESGTPTPIPIPRTPATETTETTTEEITVAVCCGCRPKATAANKTKTKKYTKELSQKGWLRVFHTKRGTNNTRRYKDTALGNDSEWTAFHHHTHHDHDYDNDDNDDNDDDDNESSTSSMFFFDAVDHPLGEDEFPFPVDGYAIGGPNSGVVFTTSIEHPAPNVSMDDPTTMLRHSAAKAVSVASSRNDDNYEVDDDDDDDDEGIDVDRRALITNHKEVSARFRRIRKRSPSELHKSLTTIQTPTTTNNNNNNLENAIGLAGYPGTLTVHELNECQKFLEGIKKLNPTVLEQVYSLRDIEETPYTICRWLRATKFNSDEILQRLQDNQYMFDEAKEYQFYGPDISKHMNNCPLSVFQSQYPFHPLGRGYNGCPIAYFLAGRINPEGILCLCSIDQLKHYFWYSFMYQMKIEMKESQKQNIDFCKCEGINVIDLKGLSTSALTHETMEVIKLSSKISDFFPEVINVKQICILFSIFSFDLDPQSS